MPENSSNTKWIAAGRVGRPHGVAGEVRLRLLPGAGTTLGPGQQVRLTPRSGESREVGVLALRGDAAAPIAQLEGIESREAAAGIASALLEIDADTLPPAEPDEFYYYEVVGARLVGSDGSELGSIAEVSEGGGRRYFVCETPRGEAYLPVTKEAVLKIDRAAGCVVADPAALIVPEELGEE